MEPKREPKYNSFDAPIPGQSLTDEPGNAAWEHPPQMTNIHAISLFIFKRLTTPKMTEQVILMLKEGVPAEAITRTVLFGGFMEGKWGVDTALLVARTVIQMVVAIGMKAKLKKFRIGMDDDTNLDFRRKLADVKIQTERAAKKIAEEGMTEALPEAQPGSLMASPLEEMA